MELSFFLSKALGFYFLILGFGMMINVNRFRFILLNIIDDAALLFVTGVYALILGILLVVSHNVWTMDWRVIITLVGWGALLKSTLLVLYPSFIMRVSKKWLLNNPAYYITFFIVFVIGIYLIYMGYSH